MSECSCWVKYPNPMHKGKNGKWKCVDDYECIQDLETVETPIGLTAVRRKTHCKLKMEKKRMDEIEQLKDLRAHCQDMTRGGDGIFQDLWGKDVKALDKAIEALKRQQEGKMEIIKLEKRTPEEKAAYLEGYEAGKKAGRKTGELIKKEDALAVFGDAHPMDYNANAYRKQIEELQSQSLTEIAEEMLEDIKAEICDTRCKWPEKWDKSQGELCESEHCANCPLNRI